MKSGDICSTCRLKAGVRYHIPSQKESREPWLGRSFCSIGTKLYLQSNSQWYSVKCRAAAAYLGLSWIWYYLIFSLMAWMMKDNMLIKSTDGTHLWGIVRREGQDRLQFYSVSQESPHEYMSSAAITRVWRAWRRFYPLTSSSSGSRQYSWLDADMVMAAIAPCILESHGDLRGKGLRDSICT